MEVDLIAVIPMGSICFAYNTCHAPFNAVLAVNGQTMFPIYNNRGDYTVSFCTKT